ncbi:hypothetical protein MD537_05485 [Flavihumibacter sediminis]|nr:hypothetical protein [Flavihumibacter sediminis]
MPKFPLILIVIFFAIAVSACSKDNAKQEGFVYYEVGFDTDNANWRDTAIIIRTNNAAMIQKADAQLALPVAERQIVLGELRSGSGGYNKNAAHEFKWHFDESTWDLVDITVEIYDGKPFTDVDSDTAYWLGTVKRFGAWSSYIRKRIPR